MTFNPIAELKAYIDEKLAAAEPFRRAEVTAVTSTTKVEVRLGLGTIAVSCSSGYPEPRLVGDQVLLVRRPGGGLEVLVKLSQEV